MYQKVCHVLDIMNHGVIRVELYQEGVRFCCSSSGVVPSTPARIADRFAIDTLSEFRQSHTGSTADVCGLPSSNVIEPLTLLLPGHLFLISMSHRRRGKFPPTGADNRLDIMLQMIVTKGLKRRSFVLRTARDRRQSEKKQNRSNDELT